MFPRSSRIVQSIARSILGPHRSRPLKVYSVCTSCEQVAGHSAIDATETPLRSSPRSPLRRIAIHTRTQRHQPSEQTSNFSPCYPHSPGATRWESKSVNTGVEGHMNTEGINARLPLPQMPSLSVVPTQMRICSGSPKGIRTPVSGLRGRRPRPLDDGAMNSKTILPSYIALVKRRQPPAQELDRDIGAQLMRTDVRAASTPWWKAYLRRFAESNLTPRIRRGHTPASLL